MYERLNDHEKMIMAKNVPENDNKTYAFIKPVLIRLPKEGPRVELHIH